MTTIYIISAALILALVALIALGAKLAAALHERHIAHNAAIAIQADRDMYLNMLDIESKVSNKLKTERDRLAAEVGELKAKLRQTAVTRDPKTGRMVSAKK